MSRCWFFFPRIHRILQSLLDHLSFLPPAPASRVVVCSTEKLIHISESSNNTHTHTLCAFLTHFRVVDGHFFIWNCFLVQLQSENFFLKILKRKKIYKMIRVTSGRFKKTLESSGKFWEFLVLSTVPSCSRLSWAYSCLNRNKKNIYENCWSVAISVRDFRAQQASGFYCSF